MAADHYACDCGPGADAACVAGDDGAAGTTPASAWRTYERARQAFNATLAAGDTLGFCRGGSFAVGASTQWVNPRCRADARCIVGAYDAAFAPSGAARPLILQSNGGAFSFAEPGGANHEAGYLVRDLEIACTGCTGSGQWGIFIFNDTDDLRMERLLVRGFSIGIHLAGSSACDVAAGNEACNASNDRVELAESELRDNYDQGWLGSGTGLLIADSRFDGNGSGSVFEHSVYLTQSGGATTGMRVLRNEITRSVLNAQGRCEGGAFASHGEHTGLVLEDNLVHEAAGVALQPCWGIGMTPAYATPEYFRDAIVRGNTVRNMGNVGIALASCVDCIVENNSIVHEQVFGQIAIAAPAVARGTTDAALQGLVVRNNSIYTTGPGSVALRVGTEGTGHVVVSNAIQSTAASGSFACLSLDLAASAYAAVDHNVCAFAAGTGREWEQGSGSLAAWRIASGFDAASRDAAPGFASPAGPVFDLAPIDALAPLVDAGHPLLSATYDARGALRTVPDAGAFELGGATTGVVFADGFE